MKNKLRFEKVHTVTAKDVNSGNHRGQCINNHWTLQSMDYACTYSVFAFQVVFVCVFVFALSKEKDVEVREGSQVSPHVRTLQSMDYA